jgi:hypothetical protein
MSVTTLEPPATELVERELAYRRNGALDVFLVWQPAADVVKIRVEDLRTGVRIEMDVDRSSALQAFRHPFAYVP